MSQVSTVASPMDPKVQWLALAARGWPLVWLLSWFGAALLATSLAASDALFDPVRSAPLLARGLHPPQWAHFLGFDPLGRDLQFSVLQASVRSAGFAAGAVALSTLGAVFAGSAIALAPLRLQFLALRALDTFLAFPSLLLALAWAAIRGPGWGTLLVSLLLGTLPSFTRLIYARSKEILAEPYITAARSLGATPMRITTHHLIPALSSVCTVKIPLLFAQALMAEATLSFLGVGAPVGQETWGALLATGKEYLFEAPHIALAAGVPLTLTVLALQLIATRWAGHSATAEKF